MAAWDLKPDRCTELSSCCAAAPPRKRRREGGREGDNREKRGAAWGPAESWLDGTMGELLYRIRVLKRECTFFAKGTKEHKSYV